MSVAKRFAGALRVVWGWLLRTAALSRRLLPSGEVRTSQSSDSVSTPDALNGRVDASLRPEVKGETEALQQVPSSRKEQVLGPMEEEAQEDKTLADDLERNLNISTQRGRQERTDSGPFLD